MSRLNDDSTPPAVSPRHDEQPAGDEDLLRLRSQWIQLQRLLYCMEKEPSSPSPPLPTLSWRSFLFRAHHCQALWNELLIHLEGTNEHHVTTAAVAVALWERMRETMDLPVTTQRVDQACRMDLERADRSKPSPPHERDTVDRIFFCRPPTEEHEGNDLVDETSPQTAVMVEEEEEEDSNEGTRTNRYQSSSSNHHNNAMTTPNIADLQKAQREQMEDAIAAMAERMKEATQGIQYQLHQQTTQTLSELETVAEQNVVDVTRVAHEVQQHNRRQRQRNWGTWTLMLTVAGIFCLCFITIFTIPKRPNTCLFFCAGGDNQVSLLGWVAEPFRVLSTYTIPPAYSLWQHLFEMDKKDEGDSAPLSQQETWDKVYRETEEEIVPNERLDLLLQSLEKTESKDVKAKVHVDWRDAPNADEQDFDDDDDPFGGRKPVKKTIEPDAEEDDPFGARKPIKQTIDSLSEDDFPFGSQKTVKRKFAKPVDLTQTRKQKPVKKQPRNVDALVEENPFGEKTPVGQNILIESQQIFADGRVEIVLPPKVPEKVQDVDMNELLASLKRAAEKTKEVILEDESVFGDPLANSDATVPDSAALGGGGIDIDPEARRRITPRDIRYAAEKGDIGKLRESLQLQPGYVDRQDKHKCTALHLAARRGNTEAVQLLHEHGASFAIENLRGMTPLDEAEAHLEADHPAVQFLRKIAGKSDDNDVREERLTSDNGSEEGRDKDDDAAGMVAIPEGGDISSNTVAEMDDINHDRIDPRRVENGEDDAKSSQDEFRANIVSENEDAKEDSASREGGDSHDTNANIDSRPEMEHITDDNGTEKGGMDDRIDPSEGTITDDKDRDGRDNDSASYHNINPVMGRINEDTGAENESVNDYFRSGATIGDDTIITEKEGMNDDTKSEGQQNDVVADEKRDRNDDGNSMERGDHDDSATKGSTNDDARPGIEQLSDDDHNDNAGGTDDSTIAEKGDTNSDDHSARHTERMSEEDDYSLIDSLSIPSSIPGEEEGQDFRVKAARELIVRLAMESSEQPLRIDSYLQGGRERLEQAIVEVTQPLEVKIEPKGDNLRLDLSEYTTTGRNRLDIYLESLHQGKVDAEL